MDDAYAMAAMRYVERNPVRAKMRRVPWTYRWSSATAHTGGPDPAHLLDLEAWNELVLGVNWKEMLTESDDKETLAAYNFSNQKVSGTLHMDEIPGNVRASIAPETVQMDPFERKELPLTLAVPNPEQRAEGWVTLHGDFGAAGRPVLAFRLIVKDN